MKLRDIFNAVCLFYFFISSNIWLNFKIPSNIIIALISVILLIISYHKNNIKKSRQIASLFCILFAMSIWGVMTVGLSYGILTFFYYFPAIIIFMLPTYEKKQTLFFVTKWFGIIMMLSIGIYVITSFIKLPFLEIFQLEGNDFYPPYENYIFFIRSTNIIDQIIYRFNGPFLEPGHLSVVSSLLLFANRYDFKGNKWLWVPLACIILSLSLAGYVITVFGLILLKIRNIRILSYFIIVMLSGYVFVSHIWNDGNNILNELIVSRLEYDEEKGIAGNNRTTENTDMYFDKMCHNGKIWKGLGSIEKDKNIVGAGYKIYFLRFGIISAILVLFFYLTLIPRHYNRRYVISFIILLMLTFMQRAYPWWFSWLLCFTLGCACANNKLQGSNLINSTKR